MDTNWGDDVFDIVEHSAEVDDDSDEGDNEESDKVRGFSTNESTSKSHSINGENNIPKHNTIVIKILPFYFSVRNSVSSTCSTSAKQQSSERTHNEMSEEEEKRRSKRFLNKITRKSTENMLHQTNGTGTSNHSEGDKITSLHPVSNAIKPVIRQDSADSILSSEEVTSRAFLETPGDAHSHPLKSVSRDSLRGNVRHRMSTKYSSSSRSMLSRDEYDEETDHPTMDDLNKRMATQHSNRPTSRACTTKRKKRSFSRIDPLTMKK